MCYVFLQLNPTRIPFILKWSVKLKLFLHDQYSKLKFNKMDRLKDRQKDVRQKLIRKLQFSSVELINKKL